MPGVTCCGTGGTEAAPNDENVPPPADTTAVLEPPPNAPVGPHPLALTVAIAPPPTLFATAGGDASASAARPVTSTARRRALSVDAGTRTNGTAIPAFLSYATHAALLVNALKADAGIHSTMPGARAAAHQGPLHPRSFLADPAGARRAGVPRPDTPRPAWGGVGGPEPAPALDDAHGERTAPAAGALEGRAAPPDAEQPSLPIEEQDRTPPPPTPSLKRGANLRSPSTKEIHSAAKRARPEGRATPRAQPLSPLPSAFPDSRRASRRSASLDSPRPERWGSEPADVPLPPSAESSFSDHDFESFFADTDSEDAELDDDPFNAGFADGSRGRRTMPSTAADQRGDGGHGAAGAGTAPKVAGEEAHTNPAAYAPGSLAALVAATDDVLPTAKDAFVYTPIPAGGPPTVNASSPRWLFQNLDVAQIALWEAIPGGKLFATIYGSGGADHLLDRSLFAAVASIRSELIRLTGVSSIRVNPPDPAVRPATLNAPPYGLLVHGLSHQDALRLLDMGFLLTPKVSILFFPFAVEFPSLMVNFMFISDKTNDEVRRMAVSLLRKPDIRGKILDLVGLNPRADTPQHANALARDIIKSARVDSSQRTGRGGTPTPVFNLYIDTQSSTIDEWKKWKAFFTTLHWHDAHFGTLGVHDDVFCPGCRGADHYKWACPFMALPKWNGSLPAKPPRAGALDGRAGATAKAAGPPVHVRFS